MSALSVASLCASPNPLAAHYKRFRVDERLWLTGHSHQAWPDCSALGQQRAWDDAASFLDDKWERAFERAERVRDGFAKLLGAQPAEISLGQNTHELMVKWLSALPLCDRPRIVTTDAEFHSARRLLQRLAEEGIELVIVASQPSADVGARMAEVLDARTAAVIVSSVFYDSGELAGGLELLCEACERDGAALLIDVYHHLNVVPFALREQGLERAYIIGGGYKYCQLGEGNGFLRAPEGCTLRPVITGWFAELEAPDARAAGDPFESLHGAAPSHASPPQVRYGSSRTRFAGATYDPTSHYRAAEVFDFFERMQLTPALLRALSQHQVGLLCRELDALQAPAELWTRSQLPLARMAGFVVLRSARAGELARALAARGVHCDARGHALRFGPAPYLSDAQLCQAVAILGELTRQARGG